MANIRFQRFAAGTITAVEGVLEFESNSVTPRVSCLMVTRGNINLVRSSYQSFKAQSWPNKELVIVSGSISSELEQLASSDDDIILVEAAPQHTLGELRNISVARATGDFVCQWDDDDLYDPHRVSVSLGVLQKAAVSVVFLQRLLLWWPTRNLLSISQHRLWEGSMLARRSAMPIYPALPKGEDSVIANWISQNHDVALIDCADLYCYRMTGQNTWHHGHFEMLFQNATRNFLPDEFESVLALPCFSSR